MERNRRAVAALLGRLARNSEPPVTRGPGFAGGGQRAHERDAPGDAIRRSPGAGRTLGRLRAVRAATGPPAVARAQLEHIIRAAGTIADDSDVVVIGSQAILGEFPNAPAELRRLRRRCRPPTRLRSAQTQPPPGRAGNRAGGGVAPIHQDLSGHPGFCFTG